MPSSRKRIGFLPSQEVQNIIEGLCKDNNYSQSKITGLLVEEALRLRGFLGNTANDNNKLSDRHFRSSSKDKESIKTVKITNNHNHFNLNNANLEEEINMINEFIEFKFFKKVMKNNGNIS